MMQKTHEQFTVSFIFLGQQLTRNLPSHSKELLHPLYLTFREISLLVILAISWQLNDIH